MSVYLTTLVTRTHLKADGDDEISVVPTRLEVVENNQTMHQFLTDKVTYSLTVDGLHLTEKNTEGPFLFDF